MKGSTLALLINALLVGSSLAGCGGAKSPAKSPDGGGGEETASKGRAPASESNDEAGDGEGEGPGVPKKCVDQGGTCVPPQAWVSRLCQDTYPGVTVVLFEKSSPWTRGYMRAKTKAVYASGGVSGEGFLEPGEEVIILSVRKLPEDGMQVTGAGGWDVLRWDGTCATVSTGEMGLEPFGDLKAAPVTFRYIDEPVREALRKDEDVNEAYQKRRVHCKGATMGEVSAECEKWDAKLADAIVQAARKGIELPEPEKLP